MSYLNFSEAQLPLRLHVMWVHWVVEPLLALRQPLQAPLDLLKDFGDEADEIHQGTPGGDL